MEPRTVLVRCEGSQIYKPMIIATNPGTDPKQFIQAYFDDNRDARFPRRIVAEVIEAPMSGFVIDPVRADSEKTEVSPLPTPANQNTGKQVPADRNWISKILDRVREHAASEIVITVLAIIGLLGAEALAHALG